MHQFFLDEPLSPQSLQEPLTFSRKEWQHLFVLRLDIGERFVLADGSGKEYIAEVTALDKNTLTALIREVRENGRELSTQLLLLQGLPKRDKLEFIIQKATELGASQIVPVMMARSNVRLDDKKAERKQNRLQEIAKSAAEQSKRGRIPDVAAVTRFQDALKMADGADIKLICYEEEQAQGALAACLPQLSAAKKIAVLVGPEGGISESEWQLAKDHGFQSISLGRRILRTETAGLALLSYLMLHLENA